MASVDVAEYGDVSLSGIVPSGSTIISLKPLRCSHLEKGTMSGSSPMPQLFVLRHENNGTFTPARRLTRPTLSGRWLPCDESLRRIRQAVEAGSARETPLP